MPNINITVAEKIATNTTPGVVIVCGNSDYMVTFDLDEEWAAETNRVARFLYYKDGLSLYQDVAFTGNTVNVPTLYGVAYVLVGVYAGSLRTTTPAKVLCDRSILCGDPLEVLTPQEKATLQAQIAANAAAIERLQLVGGGAAVRVAEVNLLAANWAGAASPYFQVVEIEGVTEYSQVDLTPSVEQLAIFYDKDLAFVTENEGGTVTVYAIGQKPQNDYTMQVTITEVMV
jgi:hypothetical protein